MSVDDEPRDEHGRWTAGQAGSHAAGPFMSVSSADNFAKADMVATRAAAVAKKLGYDPTLINVSDESKQFELNGKTLNYAGAAHLPPPPEKVGDTPVKGTVTLYTPHVDERTIDGVAAHEIEHQKFQAFVNDQRADYLALQQDPDYRRETRLVPYDKNSAVQAAQIKAGSAMVFSPDEHGVEQIRERGFMNANGTLNEPWASKYPAYQAWTKAMMPGTEEFAKSDGVTDYSAEYWKGHAAGTMPSNKAYHETLAEIGRLRYEGGAPEHRKLGRDMEDKPAYFRTGKGAGRLNPKWSALYRAVNDNWKRRNKS